MLLLLLLLVAAHIHLISLANLTCVMTSIADHTLPLLDAAAAAPESMVAWYTAKVLPETTWMVGTDKAIKEGKQVGCCVCAGSVRKQWGNHLGGLNG